MPKKKIAILGTTGMLGYTVLKYFLTKTDKYEIYSYSRKSNLLNDLSQKFDFNNLIFSENLLTESANEFDYTINCIGLIKPHIKNETYEECKNAVESNILIPYGLAGSPKWGKILQIATDCVFSGEQNPRHLQDCYSENSKHDALDVYGKTKSLSEVKANNYFNIRASTIAPEKFYKKSLMEWLFSQNGKSVNGFCNHFWNGLTSLEFAKVFEKIIDEDIILPNTIHLTAADWVTKYQLLVYIKEIYELDVDIKGVYDKISVDRRLSSVENKLSKYLTNKTIYKMIEETKQFNVNES